MVGALNGPSAPTQAQVTVNFPAAGSYPLEVDYTECCGGELALTLGTTAGNPISSSGCSPTPASSSLADQFGAEVCRFANDETSIGNAAVGILDAASQFPRVLQIGTTNVYQHPATGEIAARLVQIIEAKTKSMEDGLNAATSELQDAAAKKLAEQLLGGSIPCAVDALHSLQGALNSDLDSGQHYAETMQTLKDLAGGVLDASTSDLVAGTLYAAAKGQFEKLNSLHDALEGLLDDPFCFKTYAQLQAELTASEQLLIGIQTQIGDEINEIALLPLGGDTVWAPVQVGGAIPVLNDPTLPQVPPAGLDGGTTQFQAFQPPACITVEFGVAVPCPSASDIIGGSTTVDISATGLQANSVGTIGGGSSPVRLATFHADANGEFSMPVKIPNSMTAGKHELYVIGTAPDGSLKVFGETITVKADSGPPPRSKCIGKLSGTINGGLTIAPGMVCILTNATVNGGITVGTGAVFEADSSTINGGIVANAPTAFTLCGDQVNGGVSVRSSGFPPLIGGADSPTCAPTTITGGQRSSTSTKGRTRHHRRRLGDAHLHAHTSSQGQNTNH